MSRKDCQRHYHKKDERKITLPRDARSLRGAVAVPLLRLRTPSTSCIGHA